MQICSCKLFGKQFYTTRCSVCGLFRNKNNGCSFADPLDIKKYEEIKAINKRQFAIERLKQIEELCKEPIPQIIKIQKPKNYVLLTESEKRSWEKRSYSYKKYQENEVINQMKKPFDIYQKMISAPVQNRYLNAAKHLLNKYLGDLKNSDWSEYFIDYKV